MSCEAAPGGTREAHREARDGAVNDSSLSDATGGLPTVRIGRRLLVPTARLLDLLGLPVEPADAQP